MEKNGRKIWACMLSILMVVSTLAFVGTATAEQPENVQTEIGENGIPDVQISELRATTPVVYLDQSNRLVLSVANQGDATALKVTANVTDIVPKVSEELISTEHFGALRPDMERTRFVDWAPSQRGIHYIKVEIKYEYLTHNSPAEMVESPPTTLSAGFPVIPYAGPPEEWGPGLDYPSIITASEGFRTRTGPLTIEVYDDLVIESGATLELNEEVTLVMMSTYAGEYSITIHPGASFVISSPSRSTTIQSSSGNPTYTYPFENRGTVDFRGASVLYTYGDKTNLAAAGGIVNYPNSVCNLVDAHLEFADTHSIMVNGSGLSIAGTFVGRLDKTTKTNYGDGISASSVNDLSVADSEIRLNSGSGIILAGSNVAAHNVTVANNSRGVYADAGTSLSMRYSNASGNGYGIFMTGESTLELENSDVHGNIYGLSVHGNSSADVTDSVFSGNAAVSLTSPQKENGDYVQHVIWYGGGCDIRNSRINLTNNFFHNPNGILLQNSSGILENNFLLIPYTNLPEGITPAPAIGISLSSCDDVTIDNNILFGGGGYWSARGASISQSSDISFNGNIVASTGIYEYVERLRTSYTLKGSRHR